jgi:hypothetical protein
MRRFGDLMNRLPGGDEMSVATPEELALMSVEERVQRAGETLSQVEREGLGDKLNASALADEIDRRSGVGFEAATLVVLASGR